MQADKGVHGWNWCGRCDARNCRRQSASLLGRKARAWVMHASWWST